MDPQAIQITDITIESALEKKGEDVVLMDMKSVSTLCDYFVVISSLSKPHTKALAEHIEDMLKEKLGVKSYKIHGKDDGGWVLMDYGSVVIHIFLNHLRTYYDLEGLWSGATVHRPAPEIPQPAGVKQ